MIHVENALNDISTTCSGLNARLSLLRKDTAARGAALRMASRALQGELGDKLVIGREEQGQLEETHKSSEAQLRGKRCASKRNENASAKGMKLPY